MLQLGDIVVPFTTSRNPLYPLECTITEILRLDSTGTQLYPILTDRSHGLTPYDCGHGGVRPHTPS